MKSRNPSKYKINNNRLANQKLDATTLEIFDLQKSTDISH